MPRSLIGRLTVLLTIGLGLFLALSTFAFRWMIGSWIIHEADNALLAKARALVTLTTQEAEEADLDFADEYMPEYEREIEPEYFQIWLSDGTMLERSNSLVDGDLPRRRDLVTEPRFSNLTLPDGRPGRLVQVDFVPQVEDDDGIDIDVPLDPRVAVNTDGLLAATLVVAWSRGPVIARLRTLTLASLALLAGVLLATVALVQFALRIGLRPLAELTDQVSRLDATSLASRLEVASLPEEMHPVVEQLNEALGRLESAFDRERLLSSNLAHELRTPIAELRSLAQVGGRWPDDTHSVREFFADVSAITVQMEGIVSNLLALARAEGGTESIVKEAFSLREEILLAWRPLASVAAKRRIELDLEVSERIEVETDRAKLGMILANVLGNAVTYSPDGTRISCQARPEHDRTVLTISNPTRGDLQQTDVPKLFDRFWRKDTARTGGKHAGLGLTLVRTLAELMHIPIRVELEGETFRFTLSLAS